MSEGEALVAAVIDDAVGHAALTEDAATDFKIATADALVDDVEAALTAGNPGLANGLLMRSQALETDVADTVANPRAKGLNVDRFVAKMEARAQGHYDRFTDLISKAPEQARAALARAQQNSQRGFARAIAARAKARGAGLGPPDSGDRGQGRGADGPRGQGPNGSAGTDAGGGENGPTATDERADRGPPTGRGPPARNT